MKLEKVMRIWAKVISIFVILGAIALTIKEAQTSVDLYQNLLLNLFLFLILPFPLHYFAWK